MVPACCGAESCQSLNDGQNGIVAKRKEWGMEALQINDTQAEVKGSGMSPHFNQMAPHSVGKPLLLGFVHEKLREQLHILLLP